MDPTALRMKAWQFTGVSKGMTRKNIVGAIMAGLAFAALADSGEDREIFQLRTRTTSVAVARRDGTWRLKHFGERVESADGVKALAWRGPEGWR